MSRTLHIDVFFDFICPWCLIGKRQLGEALAQLRASDPDVEVTVRWRGVQLLPQAPQEGWPFMEFYIRRLGSEPAVRARQAMVLQAAATAGVQLDFPGMHVMPNTADAHRVFEAACAAAPDKADALLERLFAAHFTGGANLGDGAWLLDQAEACGVPRAALATSLQGAEQGYEEPFVQGPAPSGGVPCFVFDGYFSLSGAQPPAMLLAAARKALAAGVAQSSAQSA
jgi:predicted DsbA family dithiol-disulfide isomerase